MNPNAQNSAETQADEASINPQLIAADVARPDTLRLPFDAHTVSLALLALLAFLAVIFTLHWASAFFIPLTFGVMFSYALSPLVDAMQKWKIPRSIGAAVLLLGIVMAVSSLAYSLRDEAAATIDALPAAAKKFRETLRLERGMSESIFEKAQRATTEFEHAASDTPTPRQTLPQGVMRVQIEKPAFSIQEYLWAGTMGMVGFSGQLAIVLFLSYFLIVSGDSFRRKLVKISGPGYGQKKNTLQVLDQITGQIQRYLLVQIVTGFLVGVATWLAFVKIGVEHPAIWGVAAAVLNTIPYLGAIVVAIATGLVAFLQFGTMGMVILVSGTTMVITSLEGLLLMPWLTSRATQMNAVVVFAGVLFWGWLWGMWGLLLGIPILMAIKSICDHVEDLKPVGELLGK